MLQSKKANVLLAIVAAICLWAYVTGSVDPTTTQRVAAVPIKIINEDSLFQDGLAVESMATEYVDIVVVGTRADVNSLERGEISVTADLYGRNKGTNYIGLDIDLPKGIKVESKSIEKVQVEIGDAVSRAVTVEADVNGSLGEGEVLGDAIIEPETVMVYGTAGNLNKVKYIEAQIEAEDLTEDMKEMTAEIYAVDEKGSIVKFVKTAKSAVNVTANKHVIKQVKLEVKTKGELDSKYELKEIKVPENVYIQGTKYDVEGITSVKAEDVDISGITETVKIPLKIKLPRGVKVKSNEANLFAEIVIEPFGNKEVTYTGNEIEVKGLGEGLKAEIDDNVKITISGDDDILKNIVKSNVKLSVNLEGLGEGKHQVKLIVESDNDKINVIKDKEDVQVEIVKE